MITTIIVAVLVFGLLIFIHELGHFIAAKWAGIRVLEFALGMGPAIFKKVYKGTRYSLRALPLGGFVKMLGEEGEEEDEELKLLDEQSGIESGSYKSYYEAKPYKRFITVAAGAVMNILLGFVLIMLTLSFSGETATTTIDSFRSENAASMQKGLRPGDKIIKLDQRKINVADDIVYYMLYKTSPNVDITVRRGGETVVIAGVTLPYKEYDKSEITGDSRDKGTPYKVYLVDFYVASQKLTFFPLLRESFYKALSVATLVWNGVMDLISGRVPIRDISGPVGISSAIGNAAKVSFESLLNIVVLISINLGVLNLLPIPALDGGKLLLTIVEMLTKKRLSPKVEGLLNLVGFAALMCLVVVATYNDIWRLFS